ncbi:MAG: hypothetical protein R3A80_02770 [Bdellovibrionota bacterium]
MASSRSGFSVIEFMVGSSIMLMMLLAASSMLKPLNQANRKSRLLNAMIKTENIIRNGVYLQSTYTDTSKFEIRNGDVLVAKHGEVLFLNPEMTESVSDSDSEHPIRTQLELLTDSGGKLGVIYQVASVDKVVRMLPLGVKEWPDDTTDKAAYLTSLTTGSNAEASYASITIPKRLADSTLQECPNGFLRGITANKSIKCWEFEGATSCPTWSVPVGYRLNEAASKIEILCQKMNKLSCPDLSIPITDPVTSNPRTVNMPNFLVLKELAVTDLYPPRSANAAGASQCESVIEFGDPSSNGLIPQAIVNANNVPGLGNVCPDQNLYIKNPDGSCSPTFNLSTLQTRKPASITSPPLDIKPASETMGGQ